MCFFIVTLNRYFTHHVIPAKAGRLSDLQGRESKIRIPDIRLLVNSGLTLKL